MENVVGRVIRPAIDGRTLVWLWFSRYGGGRDISLGDTDLSAIPDAFNHGTQEIPSWRSVRFRIACDAALLPALEEAVIGLINSNDYWASSFLDYPWIDDLAADRFLGEPRTSARRVARAQLMGHFLGAAANLYLSALEGPDENLQFRQESNSDVYPWAAGSVFEPMRHLFVNMTGAPTQVAVEGQNVQPHPLGERQVLFRRQPQT